VRLWEAESGQETRRLQGHAGVVRAVAFAPDGRSLASAGSDATVRLWEAESGRETRRLQGHSGEVWAVAFAPDGRSLASAGDDGMVRLWNVADGSLLATLVGTPEGWAAITPDGRYKVSGATVGAVWFAINLCRFELGELDAFLPGRIVRVDEDAPLWTLPL
jgi:WD40 repeat protein